AASVTAPLRPLRALLSHLGGFLPDRGDSLSARRARVLAIVSAGVSLIALFFFIFESAFNPYVMLRFQVWELSEAVAFAIVAMLAKRHYAIASSLFVF